MSSVASSFPSKTVFHWKPFGRSRWTFGVYSWARDSKTRFADMNVRKRGLVIRVGPLGHLQFQRYKVTLPRSGRRPRSTLMVSWWGIAGRRKKRYIEVSIGR